MGTAKRVASFVWYPFLLSAAYLVFMAKVAILPSDLIRPIAVTWLVVGAFIGLLSRRSGRDKAALIVTGGVFLLTPQAGSLTAFGFVIAIIAIAYFAARVGHPIRVDRGLTTALNAVGVCALVLVGAGFAVTNLSSSVTTPACPTGLRAGPNMYVIMLDGYAREDTQERLFGHDDEPFLTALEADGFWVDRKSHTTYPDTSLVVPSVLNMHPLQDDPRLTRASTISHGLRDAVRQSTAVDLLHCAGYTTVATAMPYRDIEMSNADRYLGNGLITNYEISLLQSTRLAAILDIVAPGFIYEQHRQRLEGALDDLVSVAAEPTSSPRFVWTHLISPHPPFVYTPDGDVPAEPTPQRELGNRPEHDDDVDPAWFADRYIGNVVHISKLVRSAVEQIIASDPNAVIVVWSDHGSNMHYDLADDGPENDYAERYGNLFAVRAPGVGDLYTSPVVPLNILGPLFDHYLGTDIGLGPTDAYGPPRPGPADTIIYPPVDPTATPAP